MMNSPSSFFRSKNASATNINNTNSSNLDAYEDKTTLQSDYSSKGNFTFFGKNSLFAKPKRSIPNQSVGDGDRFGVPSSEKSSKYNDQHLLNTNSSSNHNLLEGDLLKNFLSNQRWSSSHIRSSPELQDDDHLECDDHDHDNLSKFIPSSHATSSRSLHKDNELDTINGVTTSDVHVRENRSSMSHAIVEGHSSPFRSYYFDKIRPEKRDLNILMLVGLLIALLGSKCLQYLQLYITYFQYQLGQLRSAFMNDANLWDILDFDVNARFNLRTKLMLVPILLICGILGGVINLMDFSIKIMLAPAPDGLTQIVRKLGSDTN